MIICQTFKALFWHDFFSPLNVTDIRIHFSQVFCVMKKKAKRKRKRDCCRNHSSCKIPQPQICPLGWRSASQICYWFILGYGKCRGLKGRGKQMPCRQRQLKANISLRERRGTAPSTRMCFEAKLSCGSWGWDREVQLHSRR